MKYLKTYELFGNSNIKDLKKLENILFGLKKYSIGTASNSIDNTLYIKIPITLTYIGKEQLFKGIEVFYYDKEIMIRAIKKDIKTIKDFELLFSFEINFKPTGKSSIGLKNWQDHIPLTSYYMGEQKTIKKSINDLIDYFSNEDIIKHLEAEKMGLM